MRENNDQEFDRLLTVKEVASILKISENTAKFWVSERRFDVVRVGRLVRVPEKALRGWIEENTVKRMKSPEVKRSRSLTPRRSSSFERFVEGLKEGKIN